MFECDKNSDKSEIDQYLIFIWFFFYLSDCGDLSELQTEDSGRPTVIVKEITPSNQTSVLSNEMARAFKPYPDRSAVQVGTRAIWIFCLEELGFEADVGEKQKIPSSKLSDFEGILWFNEEFSIFRHESIDFFF